METDPRAIRGLNDLLKLSMEKLQEATESLTQGPQRYRRSPKGNYYDYMQVPQAPQLPQPNMDIDIDPKANTALINLLRLSMEKLQEATKSLTQDPQRYRRSPKGNYYDYMQVPQAPQLPQLPQASQLPQQKMDM